MQELNIISLGAGVQSSALYFMSSLGQLPRADFAVFGDPGKEKKATYQYIQFMLDWQKLNNGIEIIIMNKKNLFKDLLNSENSTGHRFSSIPAFTLNENKERGMLRRQCTNEYKIEQVDKAIRQIHNLKPRQRYPKTKVWTGITLDEIERMKFSQDKWKTLVYPFLNYEASHNNVFKIDWGLKMNRNQVETWYNEMNIKIPPKSSCVFCPFQSDAAWQDMKQNHPEDFEAAILVDEAIRSSTKKGIKNKVYLHDSCKPLKEVQFNQLDIWRGNCSTDCHI